MKRTLLNSKAFTLKVAVVAAAIALAPFTSSATSDTSTTKKQVTYTGMQDRYLRFIINSPDTLQSRVILEISDEEGTLLYRQPFKKGEASKNILIDKQVESCGITFTLLNGKKVYTERFRLESKPTIIEQPVITKL